MSQPIVRLRNGALTLLVENDYISTSQVNGVSGAQS